MVVAVWGINFVLVRIGLNGFPPLLLCAIRFFFGGYSRGIFFATTTVLLAALDYFWNSAIRVSIQLLIFRHASGDVPGTSFTHYAVPGNLHGGLFGLAF